MKAMILKEAKPAEEDPLTPVELPIPAPRPREVRVRIRACGVCHTDLHLVEGELPLPVLPIVPGHQVIGNVDALGAGATRFKLGERVGVPWLYSTCGTCDYCRTGRENLCDQARFTGQHVNGGFAEYMVVSTEFAHPIPVGFSDEQAAPLLCAGVIGYRALRLCEIKAGGRLGLYGFGASAHTTIQVARHWGCEVYAFTRSAEHQRHARELGAVWTGAAQELPPRELDAAITFAPVGTVVPYALRVLRKGGTLAINAIHMSPIPEIDYELLYGERTIRSVTNLTRRDAEEFLQVAARIPVRTDVETYPLEEANAVLQRLKRGEIRGAAVLKI